MTILEAIQNGKSIDGIVNFGPGPKLVILLELKLM